MGGRGARKLCVEAFSLFVETGMKEEEEDEERETNALVDTFIGWNPLKEGGRCGGRC